MYLYAIFVVMQTVILKNCYDVQKLTDKYVASVEAMLSKKEVELMEV